MPTAFAVAELTLIVAISSLAANDVLVTLAHEKSL